MPSDVKKLEPLARDFASHFRSFNPQGPSLCLRCFGAFELSAEAHEHLGVKVPEFYDALMRFVISDHTLVRNERVEISVALLLYQTTQCPRCSVLEQQPIAINIGETPFDTLYDHCCQILATYLSMPYWHTQKKLFRSGRWPSSPAALLPMGVERTVAGLVRLASVSYSGPVALFGAILQRYRQPVFEAIVKPGHESLLLQRIIGAFQQAGKRAAKALAAHNVSIGAYGSSASPSEEGDTAILPMLVGRYHGFTYLLRVIFCGVDHAVHDFFRFASGYEVDLYRAITSVLVNFADPKAWDPYLLDVVLALYARLEADDRSDPPPFIRLAVADDVQRNADIYIRLASLLPTLLSRRGCFGPQCGKQLHESSDGKPFAKCARCKIVQYCSKDCQRKDWSSKRRERDTESHKEICDILCEVVTILKPNAIGRRPSKDEIARMCREGSFPEDRARRLAEWILDRDLAHTPPTFKDILNESIGKFKHSAGTMPLPRSIRECKTEEEMFSFLERTSGRRYTPGSRIVMIPVQAAFLLTTAAQWSHSRPMRRTSFKRLPEAGKHYSGPYLLKILPPNSS
ncbi:hypothetical protein EXIGLDRAFT_752363 [Exidia glandulosa HHB12029]|uniref:MYND-type domain-containing protein n=1 Tax=Exidia glandulosa HHB12029 TaxID=1314781 RepID=A0A165ZZS2_EXIGL|nr:hypothetical protein EXIGLDRAFT_752363 [Exidia glandulosa HHB12029]